MIGWSSNNRQLEHINHAVRKRKGKEKQNAQKNVEKNMNRKRQLNNYSMKIHLNTTSSSK